MSSITEIESELIELAQHQKRDWQRIAELLLQVQDAAELPPGFKSFTQWVRHIAAKARMHESNFWRYLKAGSFYLKSKNTADTSVLHESTATPEALEFIEKISKNAPEKTVSELITKAENNSITQRELKELHERYKYRGGTSTPISDSEEEENEPADLPVASFIKDSLRANMSVLFRGGSADKSAAFEEVAVRPGTTRSARRIDFVVYYREQPWSHERFVTGVEVKSSLSDFNSDRKMTEYVGYTDQFYVAIPDNHELLTTVLDGLPDSSGIGVITVADDGTLQKRKESKFVRGECRQEIFPSMLDRELDW